MVDCFSSSVSGREVLETNDCDRFAVYEPSVDDSDPCSVEVRSG